MLVLHIGTQKTGSSSVQHFLRENQEHFRGVGINFVSAIRDWSDHNKLARELRGGSVDLPRLQAVVDEVALNPDAINIVSAEELFHPRVPERLCQLLSEDDRKNTKIIVYLRRPDHLMEALYKQRLKTGEIRPGPTAYLKENSWEADYLPTLNEFKKYFGEGSLVIRPYNRAQLRDRDIVSDFLHLIGANYSDNLSRSLPEDNPTFSAAVSELMGFLCRNSDLKFHAINAEIAKLTWPNIKRSGDVFTRQQRLELMAGREEDLMEVAETYNEDLDQCFSFDDLKKGVETYPSDKDRAALNMQAGKAVTFATSKFFKS